MKDYLRRLPDELQELIRRVSDQAHRRGAPVYLVGGFVRDLLLGERNFDLDIIVEADGIAFAEELAASLGVKMVRHRRFGTATIAVKPHLKLDIATVRREYYPGPGHLPVVEPGSLKEDALRRDFTVNAMAVDITRRHYGELIDFFGGQKDLREKKIRVLHEASFLDDPTRILRAVRFEQRFGFAIEPRTLRLLKAALAQDMLCRVDEQRIRDELTLLLKEDRPVYGIRRLARLTGLSFLKPRPATNAGTYALLGEIEKQVRWFQRLYGQRRALDLWLIYFMGLTESLSALQLKRLIRAYGFRKSDEKRLLDYRKAGAKVRLLQKSAVRPSGIYRFLEPLSYESILMLKSRYRGRSLQKHIEDFFEIYNGMRLSISGHDIHALGMEPGPVYQKIFSRVLHAKLDGEIATRDEEIALIKKIVRRMKNKLL